LKLILCCVVELSYFLNSYTYIKYLYSPLLMVYNNWNMFNLFSNQPNNVYNASIYNFIHSIVWHMRQYR